eukprot:768104-Hanusia_phi.AAC.5
MRVVFPKKAFGSKQPDLEKVGRELMIAVLELIQLACNFVNTRACERHFADRALLSISMCLTRKHVHPASSPTDEILPQDYTRRENIRGYHAMCECTIQE